jgi:hypothetical protein
MSYPGNLKSGFYCVTTAVLEQILCTAYMQNIWKRGQNLWKIPSFIWMTLSKPSITNNAELSSQFKVSNGVPIEEVKCSDQLSHLKIFTESCFNNEEFTSLLAYQKIQITQKMVSATPKLLKMSQFFAFPLYNANVQ